MTIDEMILVVAEAKAEITRLRAEREALWVEAFIKGADFGYGIRDPHAKHERQKWYKIYKARRRWKEREAKRAS